MLNKKIVGGVLAFILVLVFYAVYQKTDQKPAVVFLDVGQGDSQLIILPGDVQILVDAGPSNRISAKLAAYLPFYDKDIELAILTHPHMDHLNGFVSVFRDYNVKNFIFSGANYESKLYADFLKILESEGSSVYTARVGDIVNYNSQPILKIISPAQVLLGQSFKNIHDSVIVSELNFGHKKFLLTGDADEVLDRKLMALNLLGDVDVLKVGHHGSQTATPMELLRAVRPEEAVIQVGNNSYGHPTQTVLDRLAEFGVKIFRNDEVGDVIYK